MRIAALVALVAPALALAAGPQDAPAAGAPALSAPAPGQEGLPPDVVRTQPVILGSDPAPAAPPAPAPAAPPAPAPVAPPAPAPVAPPPEALAPVAPPAVAGAPARASLPGASRFGIALAAGVPSGGGLSVTFRPTRVLRVGAGPSWNYASWGIQGGVTLVPWSFGFTPTLGVEAGHYFAADVSRFVRSGIPDAARPLMQRIGYDYAAALVGLEMGSQDGFSSFIRVGLAYLAMEAKGSGTTTTSGGTSGTGTAQVTLTDPRLRATLPSLQLGVQYCF